MITFYRSSFLFCFHVPASQFRFHGPSLPTTTLHTLALSSSITFACQNPNLLKHISAPKLLMAARKMMQRTYVVTGGIQLMITSTCWNNFPGPRWNRFCLGCTSANWNFLDNFCFLVNPPPDQKHSLFSQPIPRHQGDSGPSHPRVDNMGSANQIFHLSLP